MTRAKSISMQCGLDMVTTEKQQTGSGSVSETNSDYLVLVIDDNTSLLLSTKAIVEANGFQCVTADGGRSGLDLLEKLSVDIVLLDLEMPGISGYEVLDTINQQQFDVDVIIVSGEATFDNATRVFRDGVYDFINKPYEPKQLIKTLENISLKRDMRSRLTEMTRQLEESEKRYRFIVSNSPDIIYMLDHQGRFSFINDRVTDLLGYKPLDLVGKHYSMLVHRDDVLIAEHVFDERRTGERASHNVEFRLKCADEEMGSKPFENNTIVVEMNSMGVYAKDHDQVPFLGTYGVARDISERKKAQEMIHFQAYHDLLTQLPNRGLFLDRLDLAKNQAERNQTKLAVLFLDMDGFKFINDTLGHFIGDSLLRKVARRLQNTLRNSDTVSRIGGDEFNILLPELQEADEAGLIAKKIIHAFSKPIHVENHEITISFSIGISIFPDDGSSNDQLVKNADMAMYHIKGRGKNGFEFFSDNMQSIYQFRHSVEQDIHRALESHHLEAYFQPQYSVNDLQIVGLEALIRWNHPEKGLINPDKFIPIAEEMGLISEIGKFMLHSACGQIREWLDQGIDPVKVAVNVSAYQLAQTDFDVTLCDLVKTYDIPHNLLMVEITETALVQELNLILPRLQNLVKCGIGLCIDDFGVGYSSLSYLQTLPIDTIKIDRSFLQCTDQSTSSKKSCIIKAMVAMAQELKLNVIVEGVETQQQLDYVQAIGAKIVQGFLLNKPLPVKKITKLLKNT